jgi:hydroxylamine dehydrogenase
MRIVKVIWSGVLLASLVMFPRAMGAQLTCLECHEKAETNMVEAWRQSMHAEAGVGCAECHGEDHSAIFAVKGQVSAAVCGKCHSEQVKQFDESLHAAAMDLLVDDPKFKRLSPAMAEMGCVSCHQVGARSYDGNRGKCNVCHSGHSFSSQEARRPEACAMCHTGPDHPHMEMWQNSKHGQLFANESTRDQAPTCVTCHMPNGNHHTGFGLTLGQVASGSVFEGEKAPIPMRTIGRRDARKNRAAMVKTCLPCHSSRFASESLETADKIKIEVDQLLQEAVDVIGALEEEGLLSGERLVAGEELNDPIVQAGLQPGANQLYDDLSPVEQRFFDMFKFHHATSFKGAYHQSPEYTHNEGFLKMKQDLTFIRSEARKLRLKTTSNRSK